MSLTAVGRKAIIKISDQWMLGIGAYVNLSQQQSIQNINIAMFQSQRRVDKQQIFQEIDQLIQNIRTRLNKSLLLISHKKLPLLPQPKSLQGGELKDYQLEALSWMVQLANNNLSGILADDMGLGKTIQAISYLSYIYETKGLKGKHLIVVPKNVLNNWMRQLKTWNPIFQVVILPGTQVEREQCLKKHIKTSNFDILIATFQSVQSSERALKRFSWETLIVDEAHSIKNDQTMIACCLRRLTSKFCLLLTGTPLSNELKQLWSLLNFIVPDIFRDSQLFRNIQDSVNLDSKNEEQKIKYQSEVAAKFKAIINPFLLRRVKSQIKLGLKEKKEFTLFVSLSQLQLKMYRNFLKFHSVYGEGDGYQESRHTQLRKICGHPYLFSDIQDPNAPPYGEHLVQNSGKMKLLDKLLVKLLKQKHKILIFSQFVIFLKILQDYCSYREYKYSLITGQSSLQQRDSEVDRFSNSNDTNLFLISTRAGGLGLNLVAADVVILYDLDWNPQIDKQAMDRAYRIGQKNSVKVFKLITLNTIEERILEVQKYKLIWDELVIQKGGLAKIKAAEQKFEKIDHNKLAGLGAEQIFKLQQNLDDKTIDQIIKMGEQKDKEKTQQIRAKLQKQLKNFVNESKNPFQNLFDGEIDIRNIEYEAEGVGNKKNTTRARPGWRDRKQEKVESIKFIEPKPYHFFKNIQAAGQLLFELKEVEEQQKQKIRTKLSQLGFYQWKLSEYELFVQANKMYEANDYANISRHIKTKSHKEVKKYSEEFFEKAGQIPKLAKDFKKIKLEQQKLQKLRKHKQLQKKIKQIPPELFNFKNKAVPIHQISRQASMRMHLNGVIENGLCFEEHKDLVYLLNSKCVEKVKKQFGSTTNAIANYSKILGYFEEKSEEELYDQMKKRYELLEKVYLCEGKVKGKGEKIQEEDSAKTEIKRVKA